MQLREDNGQLAASDGMEDLLIGLRPKSNG
jgi:hypothetical protein